jgi:hypothetical protein
MLLWYRPKGILLNNSAIVFHTNMICTSFESGCPVVQPFIILVKIPSSSGVGGASEVPLGRYNVTKTIGQERVNI